MNCLANIKFLDALEQPIQGLVHQLWVGSLIMLLLPVVNLFGLSDL